MALDRAQVISDISLTEDMSYLVTVKFFDSADPDTRIWPDEAFVIPSGATTAQLQATVLARGQQIRTGLAARAAARLAVPISTTVVVP